MNDDWEEYSSYSDVASAEVVAGLLRSNGVPVVVLADEPLPGLITRVIVSVPADLLHRAKWVAAQAPLTDAELTFLATGKLGSDD
jgi:hypothetical protein